MRDQNHMWNLEYFNCLGSTTQNDARCTYEIQSSGVPRGGLGGSTPPPRIPEDANTQDVWKKGSKILKLPPVRNCFTLAMKNKLVVIINSLKVPKM